MPTPAFGTITIKDGSGNFQNAGVYKDSGGNITPGHFIGSTIGQLSGWTPYATASGSTLMVSGLAGTSIYVYWMALTSVGANTVNIFSGSSVILGPIFMVQGVPFILPFTGEPYCIAAPGVSLNINLSSAGGVGGRIGYLQF